MKKLVLILSVLLTVGCSRLEQADTIAEHLIKQQQYDYLLGLCKDQGGVIVIWHHESSEDKGFIPSGVTCNDGATIEMDADFIYRFEEGDYE